MNIDFKHIDLLFYDFLTCGISSNNSRFCTNKNESFIFWSNQQRLQAIFKDAHLFLPMMESQNKEIIIDNLWTTLQPLYFKMTRIQSKSTFVKDNILVVNLQLYNNDITIIFTV